MTIIEKIEKFIEEGKKCNYILPRWIDDDDMKVYVRKGHHVLIPPKNIFVCFDIASVEVEEDKRGNGIFSEFLKKVHEINPWDATYIESVLNDNLANFLLKNGWTMIPGSLPKSFFLMKGKK